jgi:hypothetical protein
MLVAFAFASLVTIHVRRAYLRRTAALRFGRFGTAVMLSLVWIAAFIPIARLSLWARA